MTSTDKKINYLKTDVKFMNCGIPKILHQTWKDENIPDKWKYTQGEWMNYHKDWKYVLWTDENIREYISKYHPSFLDLHDSYEYNIQRADMIRYFVLYDFGGVYCDMDMYPLKNIESYLTANMNYFVYSPNRDIFTNCIMISPIKSPIMKIIQDHLKDEIPSYIMGKYLTVLYSTGPSFVDRILSNEISDPFVILPRKMFNPYSMAHDKIMNDNIQEMYINTIDNTSTWLEWDAYLANFIVKYKNSFIVLGIVSLICIIFFLIYYCIKYNNCKKEKSECEKTCSA
jgi:mannosyltransferase OCH1-like enzyme